MNPAQTRILIAEDQTLVAETISHFLQKYSEYILVGNCQNKHDILWMLQKHEVDVVLLDLNIPQERFGPANMAGLEVLDFIRENYKNKTQAIILSSFNDHKLTRQVLDKGAWGYLLKTSTTRELHKAIQTVRNGQIYLQSEVRNALQIKSNASESELMVIRLTSREKEVVRMVAHGKTSKEIAFDLNLSPHTINEFKDNIQKKLGARNSSEMIRIVYEQKLL
jgi:DNA-binding NarL/FixJ family response regulator